MNFKDKYGEWALVAGGSEGMGGAYSTRLAKEGMNVAVIGRNSDKVEAKCAELRENFRVKARAVVADLGLAEAPEQVIRAVEDLEIGFFVYNAGLTKMQPYNTADPEFEAYALNVNVRTLMLLTMHFQKLMTAKNKGGIILMASNGGVVGSPYIANYSAAKAFIFTLAEALWGEALGTNVDIIGVLPGSTIGQSFKEVPEGTPGYQTGAEVVEEVFAAFGKGSPTVISGEHNRQSVAKLFDGEVRKEHIKFMKSAMESLIEQFGEEAK